ncbi:MAG: prolyl aminopeptidase [Gammaproteobacteria bacterium]|nr:prolyl aminopeptidase [Gammaproteobacteria bacterium]
MSQLFPEIEPYASHSLAVSELHTLYVEESGNPEGIPMLFLHGGPGAGCEAVHRRFYDPAIYRIILFDQRGCGRSTPHAELVGNTTWDLVSDMEKIREYLGIDQWALFGGSWGSTLALAYAQSHPDRVLGLILRGIFLARPSDIQWFYQQGTSRMFPDYWQDFIAPVAEADRHDMVTAYYRLLTSVDEQIRMEAAQAWSVWEGRTANITQNRQVVAHFSDPHSALSIARIECHYFINDSFMQPDQLLRNMDRIRHIPGYIIHGRYDAICPLEQAWALHQVWPESTLEVCPVSGHSVLEPEISKALLAAVADLAQRLGA